MTKSFDPNKYLQSNPNLKKALENFEIACAEYFRDGGEDLQLKNMRMSELRELCRSLAAGRVIKP